MLALKLRQITVYAATGMFFAVGAASQLQGASLQDTVLKSTVSCGVLVILGMALVWVVEAAEQQEARAARDKSSQSSTDRRTTNEQASSNTL